MIPFYSLTLRSTCAVFGILVGLLGWGGGLTPESVQAQSNEANPLQSMQEQFEADSTQPASSAKLVSADMRLKATPVPMGEAVEIALVMEIEEGWHVNAHRPTFDYLIGTSVQWEGGSGMQVTDTRYPAPKSLRLDFAGEAIDAYEGRSVVRARMTPSSGSGPGERRLTGRLRVQACNDKTCLRPATVRATLQVPVAEVGTVSEPTGDPVFGEEAPAGSAPDAGTGSSLDGQVIGAFLWKYGALLAGGLLVLGTGLFLWLQGRVQEDAA